MLSINHRRDNLVATKKYNIPLQGNPGAEVHVIENKYDDGQYELHGIAVDAETKRHLPRAVYKDMTVRDPAQLDNARKTIVARVAASLHKSTKRVAPRRKGGIEDAPKTKFDLAFDYLSMNNVPVPGWNDLTRTAALAWFRKHFLPLLNEDFCDDAINSITGPAISRWKAEQRTLVANNNRRKTEVTVDTTMLRHYQQVAKIYSVMRQIDPSLPGLDPTEFGMRGTKSLELEQCKSIPECIRQRYWRRLEAEAEHNPRMAFCAIIQACGDTRTAEAAATNPSDVVFFGEWSVVKVLSQERNRKKEGRLKTTNSYRLVTLPSWPTMILQTCIHNMGSVDSDTVLTTAEELSDWVVDILLQCGFTKELLDNVMRADSLFPDIENSLDMITYDLTGYIWRRDCISVHKNYNGFSSYELDSIIGHKKHQPNLAHNDLRLVEELKALSYRMERYVYSTDPSLTRNPAYRPVEVDGDTCLDIIPFRKTRLKNTSEQPLLLSLDMLAAEPGEPIYLHAPRYCNKRVHRSTPYRSGPRLLIGDNTIQ